MAADTALAAEAAGRDTVTAEYGGRQWRIPLDVDTWPLDAVARSLGVVPRSGEIVVNHIPLAQALQGILGEQWRAFTAHAAPRRRDLAPASEAIAEAAGFATADQIPGQARAFAGLPRLLAVIKRWPTAVESDLNRFWGIDYRDRFRFDPDGRRLLTLRQVHARLQHLPGDSALAVAMNRRSPVELLLMDLYEPLAGRAHPARPLTPEQIAERADAAAKMAKARAEYEKRRVAQGHRSGDKIATALDNARANAQRGRNG